MRTALSIAGSDPSAGAGIQADLKTISAFGVYGLTAITAITVQNTQQVRSVQKVRPDIVKDQILCLAEDIPIHAVKIGMVFDREIIEAIAETLEECRRMPKVLDPVMISKSGYSLLQEEARQSLIERLLPHADLVTPNILEAEAITGDRIDSEPAMRQAAEKIRRLGPARVVIKGGHSQMAEATDIYLDESGFRSYPAPRIATRNTHGTGCTFSSAIAAGLALGWDYPAAVAKAKEYISRALASSVSLGSGHGPTHHFHAFYSLEETGPAEPLEPGFLPSQSPGDRP